MTLNFNKLIPDAHTMTPEQKLAEAELRHALLTFSKCCPELAHITVVAGWGLDPDEQETCVAIACPHAEVTEYEVARSSADCARHAGVYADERAMDIFNEVTQDEAVETPA